MSLLGFFRRLFGPELSKDGYRIVKHEDPRLLVEVISEPKRMKGAPFTSESRRVTRKPQPWQLAPDWETCGADRWNRIKVEPLVWKDGEVIWTQTKSKKRFRLRVVPQRSGGYGYDEDRAIIVHVVAKGRSVAVCHLSEVHTAFSTHIEAHQKSVEVGNWDSGDRLRIEVLATETVDDPVLP